MPGGLSSVVNSLQEEGQSIILDFERTSDTSGKLTWSKPPTYRAYAGIIITGSVEAINPSNYPTNSVRYTASPNFQSPADTIGSAQVVGAFYNDKTTVALEVTGLDPTEVYFFSAHIVSNVNTYYRIGVRSYPEDVAGDSYAGDIVKAFEPPLNPTVGAVYFDENQQLILFWDGNSWNPTSTHTTVTYEYDPPGPPDGDQALGDFYYNTKLKQIKTWNGAAWIPVPTQDEGVPMYARHEVGTDSTYSVRANLIDVLKKQLGYPVMCVELTEDHFNIAIDNALMELRRRSDSAYTRRHFFMTLLPNQDVYYLNDPALGTGKIADVLKIHRMNTAGFGVFGSSAHDSVYAQAFLSQLLSPHGGYDLVSIHLMHSLAKTYSLLFAGDIAYNWTEATRELQVFRRVGFPEKVLVECSIERTEQELMLDRYAQQWLQSWAESEAMLILGRIRGKFTTLPGPGGGLSLNAESLIADAKEMQTECLRQIMDFEVGQNGPGGFGNTAFLMG